jgi:gamma-glutamyl hydrolase
VVVIPWNVAPEQLQWYASRVNAVLFAGGGLEDGETMSAYFRNVIDWYDTSIAMSKRGQSLVLWGTCQGFQVLCAASARNLSVIEENIVHGLYPLMLPLNLTEASISSRMLGINSTSPDVLEVLANHATTLNWHHDAVRLPSWQLHPSMSQMIVTATNCDPAGVEFVSAIEHKTAPIFASQFHPERPPYEFKNSLIGHSVDVMMASQYFANFLAAQARMSKNSFDGGDSEIEAHSVHNYALSNNGYGDALYWLP